MIRDCMELNEYTSILGLFIILIFPLQHHPCTKVNNKKTNTLVFVYLDSTNKYKLKTEIHSPLVDTSLSPSLHCCD